MTNQEQDLFIQLCNLQDSSAQTIASLLPQAATPALLGHLFFNRMAAAASVTLKKHGLLSQVNREFRQSLMDSREQNIRKNESFYAGVALVSLALRSLPCPYAMLKGALLCGLYPQGCRTASDIDLLLRPEDVTTVGQALTAAGFRQGFVREGVFHPASRQEIIRSRMTRGETVPYVKEMKLPGLPFLEADLNFSLSYKNSRETALTQMLSCTRTTVIQGVCLQTLSPEDFLIHLCLHLYKEASTLPWVAMQRDMTFYKYSDLHLLLSSMQEGDIRGLFRRAAELHVSEPCAFALWQTASLFNMDSHPAAQEAARHLAGRETILHQVYSPEDQKLYRYQEKDLRTRLFSPDRLSLLKEESKPL